MGAASDCWHTRMCHHTVYDHECPTLNGLLRLLHWIMQFLPKLSIHLNWIGTVSIVTLLLSILHKITGSRVTLVDYTFLNYRACLNKEYRIQCCKSTGYAQKVINKAKEFEQSIKNSWKLSHSMCKDKRLNERLKLCDVEQLLFNIKLLLYVIHSIKATTHLYTHTSLMVNC